MKGWKSRRAGARKEKRQGGLGKGSGIPVLKNTNVWGPDPLKYSSSTTPLPR